jgi:NAD(P)-dependent dehydrogenase (short-subunit alcohol dehydrogenase family)
MIKAFYDSHPEMRAAAIEAVPQKRLGTQEEVAELVSFLLTSSAQYINGVVVSIDGGFANTRR